MTEFKRGMNDITSLEDDQAEPPQKPADADKADAEDKPAEKNIG